MENPKKDRAQGTYTTLKECLTDPEYLRVLERMNQSQKEAYKNHYYD